LHRYPRWGPAPLRGRSRDPAALARDERRDSPRRDRELRRELRVQSQRFFALPQAALEGLREVLEAAEENRRDT
jgi:hypothetical protein